MNLLRILQVSSSGLAAERTRLQTTSSNIANARTTRTGDGEGPYLRKVPVFRAVEVPGAEFGDLMAAELEAPTVVDIIEDPRDVEMVYDPPWNPDMITEDGKKQLGLD